MTNGNQDAKANTKLNFSVQRWNSKWSILIGEFCLHMSSEAGEQGKERNPEDEK